MPFLQIEYHELETFNGDSSSVVVEEQSFSMEQLQPGRNYSLAVKAVSNGIESLERRIYQATREYSAEPAPHCLLEYNDRAGLYRGMTGCIDGDDVADLINRFSMPLKSSAVSAQLATGGPHTNTVQ